MEDNLNFDYRIVKLKLKISEISPGAWMGVTCSVLCFCLLYCVVPYSTGYEQERQTIFSWVIHGYTELENGEWGFGFFVLPTALAMLWFTRDRFSEIPAEGAWGGLAIILFALLCYLAGYKANQKYVGYFSGHILIAGMIVWYLGWRYFFKLLWLWIFLGMMWPLIPLIDVISFPLRKVATEATVFIWNLFGGNAIRNGTAIVNEASELVKEGEAYSLKVDAACSGMRSLFALLMISLIFAFVGVKSSVHRLIVVATMIPIAVAGNVIRIMLLLGGTILWGNDFAVGTDAEPSGYHLGAGFAVYFIALFSMFLLVGALSGGLKGFLKRKKVVSRIVK
jgi:exosortase